MIRLAFYKARGEWLDRLIRWWTRGPYSHVELVLDHPGGEVTILSSSPRDGGVRERRLVLNPDHWDLLAVPGDEAMAAAFIRGQIGKPYDWVGILLTHVLPFGWHSPRAWYCSEIIGAALRGAQATWPQVPTALHPNALYVWLRQTDTAPAE